MASRPPEPDDATLASRVRSGDEDALARLYDRHSEALHSLAISMVKEPADAEEVVTDAFLKLWQGGWSAERGSVGAYLHVVARSRALDLIRARKRRGRAEEGGARQEPSGFALPVSNPGPGPEEAAHRTDRRDWIGAALGQLSEAQRTAIPLAYLSGMTQREIAEHLSEPLGTVKTRIRDGMHRLRDLAPTLSGGAG